MSCIKSLDLVTDVYFQSFGSYCLLTLVKLEKYWWG